MSAREGMEQRGLMDTLDSTWSLSAMPLVHWSAVRLHYTPACEQPLDVFYGFINPSIGPNCMISLAYRLILDAFSMI